MHGIDKFKIFYQLDATISPVLCLTFIYGLTCFGRPHAHHQELNNCSSSLWFYLRSVAITVLLVVVGPVYNLLLMASPRSEGKTRGCYCSCWAPDNGREDARNMLSRKYTSSKIQEKSLFLVGDLFELYDDVRTYKFKFKIPIYCVTEIRLFSIHCDSKP
jgi:hypothetical protein